MFLFNFCRRLKDRHGKKISFLILLSFLAAFVSARIYAILYMFLDAPVIFIKGVHVHHLNFGIFFLAISGFLAFYLSNSVWRNKVIILYSVGLGLTFDEFGMWLHLEDHYWMRASYDAIVIIFVILINAVFFGERWIGVFRRVFLRTLANKEKGKNFAETDLTVF